MASPSGQFPIIAACSPRCRLLRASPLAGSYGEAGGGMV